MKMTFNGVIQVIIYLLDKDHTYIGKLRYQKQIMFKILHQETDFNSISSLKNIICELIHLNSIPKCSISNMICFWYRNFSLEAWFFVGFYKVETFRLFPVKNEGW